MAWVLAVLAAAALLVLALRQRALLRQLRELAEWSEELQQDPGGPLPRSSVYASGRGPLRRLAVNLLQLARARAEEHAAAREEVFWRRSLVEMLPLGVLLIDGAGRLAFANRAACGLLRIAPNQIGMPYPMVVRHFELGEAIEQVRARQRAMKTEIALFSREDRSLAVTLQPLGAPDADGILAVLQENSGFRRLQQVRERFFMDASHELRTPATALAGFVETLLEGGESEAERREYLMLMREEAERLTRLVDEILQLARHDADSLPPVLVPIRLRAYIEALAERVRWQAEQAGLDLRLTIEEGVPEEWRTDPDRLDAILTNLLGNAVKYTPEGGWIALSVNVRDGRLCFRVEDTGVGIPEAEQERVWDRFYRVDRGRNRRSGGAGLGLSIVREAVSALEGEVSLSSRLGRGTVVEVCLPGRESG